MADEPENSFVFCLIFESIGIEDRMKYQNRNWNQNEKLMETKKKKKIENNNNKMREK